MPNKYKCDKCKKILDFSLDLNAFKDENKGLHLNVFEDDQKELLHTHICPPCFKNIKIWLSEK